MLPKESAENLSPSRAAFLYDASRALNLRYISVLQFKGFNERDSNIVSFVRDPLL